MTLDPGSKPYRGDGYVDLNGLAILSVMPLLSGKKHLGNSPWSLGTSIRKTNKPVAPSSTAARLLGIEITDVFSPTQGAAI
jgi:hypothetical protein